MLPLGHVAFAYLLYVGAAVVTDRRLPARLALGPLIGASLLPDVIDKPLAYYGVLSSGRAFGHSLLAFVLFMFAVGLLSRKISTRTSVARWQQLAHVSPLPFGIGYGSHLLGDAYHALLTGNYAEATYLLWPLLSAPVYPSDDIPPWMRLWRIYQQPTTHDQLSLLLLAAALFIGIRLKARRKTS